MPEQTELSFERNRILNSAKSYFESQSGVFGLFVCGSIADGSADEYSDIDLRVVCEDGEFQSILSRRSEVPKFWGEFLFHETIGTLHTVSYFAPFNKIDVFYISKSDLKPSPWYALPVSILFDPTSYIKNVVAQSAMLRFVSDPQQIESLFAKVIAGLHESAKRLFRNELIYGHRLAMSASDLLMYIEDALEERPPLGPSKFEKRSKSDLVKVLRGLEGATTPQKLKDLLTQLTTQAEIILKMAEGKGLVGPKMSLTYGAALKVLLQRL